jgi:hypothetical protein
MLRNLRFVGARSKKSGKEIEGRKGSPAHGLSLSVVRSMERVGMLSAVFCAIFVFECMFNLFNYLNPSLNFLCFV